MQCSFVNFDHSCLPQSVDTFRQHPGHQGECPAASGKAQQRLEEGM